MMMMSYQRSQSYVRVRVCVNAPLAVSHSTDHEALYKYFTYSFGQRLAVVR